MSIRSASVALSLLLSFAACTDSGVRVFSEPPEVDSFLATRSPITRGTSSALIATFTGGTGIIDHDLGDVASGIATSVSPTESTTYTLTVTNPAGKTATAQVTIEVLDAPDAPIIDAPTHVTAGRSGYTASIQSREGLTFSWSIQGGAIDGETSGSSVSFTPGTSGSVSLSCAATDHLGAAATSTATALIVAPPSSPVIAAPAYVAAGKSYSASIQAPSTTSTYAWTLSGATPSTATGPSVTFTPTGEPGSSISLSCVETNQAGTTGEPGVASSAILAAQISLVIELPPFVTSGQSAQASLLDPVDSSTYHWTIEGGALQNTTGASVVFTPEGEPGSLFSLSCVETNIAGSKGSPGTASSTVIAPPTQPSIEAPQRVTLGGAYAASVRDPNPESHYAWSISGGSLAAATGPSVTFLPTGAPGASVILLCTETNRAGAASAPGTASSLVVAAALPPVIDAPSLATAGVPHSASVIAPSATSTYTWSIAGGTLQNTAGASVTFTPDHASAQLTLFCIETNLAGTPGSPGAASVAVIQPPGVPIIQLPPHVTPGRQASASVANLVGTSSYVWTINGASAPVKTGPTISFEVTAAAGSAVALSCIEINQAGTSGEVGTAAAIVVDGSLAPVIDAPLYVTGGATGSASVMNALHSSTYRWEISGGTLDSSTGPSVTFTAAPDIGGAVTLGCTETNQAGAESGQGTALSLIVAPPAPPAIDRPAHVVPEKSYRASVESSNGASTYHWTLVGALPAQATGASVAFTPTAPVGSQITITCAETNQAGATGQATQTAIPVIGESGVPLVSAPEYATQGLPFTSRIQGPVTTSTYHWSISGGTLDSNTGASVTFTPTEIVGGKVELSCVEETMAGERGEPGYAASTIAAPPIMPVIATPEYLSAGKSFSATVQNPVASSTYTWTLTGANPGKAWGPSFTFTPTATAGGEVALSCTETNRAGTTGPAAILTRGIVAMPTVPAIEAPPLVTSGASASAHVKEPVAGSRYTWSITGGTLESAEGESVTFTPAGAAGQSVTLHCVETNRAGVSGGRGNALATIVAAPVAPALYTPPYVTAGGRYTAQVLSAVGSSTYAWAIEGGTLEETEGTAVHFTPTGSAGELVTLRCTEKNQAGSLGATSVTSSTIAAAPAAPVIEAPSMVLPGNRYVASVANWVNTSHYLWTITGAVPSTASGPSIEFWPNGAVGEVVTLSCTETNRAETAGPAGTAVSAIVAMPQAPSITAPAYVTAGEQYTARIASPLATESYAWAIAGGELLSSAGEQVLFTAGESGIVTLIATPKNSAGAGLPGSATCLVVAAPATPQISAPQYVTAHKTYAATVVSPVAGSTYTWNISGGTLAAEEGASVSFTAGDPGVVMLFCTETNRAGSEGLPATAQSTSVAAPAVPVINAPTGVFPNRYASASVATQTGAIYRWEIDAGAISNDQAAAVAFSVPTPGKVNLSCTVSNLAGDSATSSKTIIAWSKIGQSMLDEPAARIATRYNHTCAITTSGNVKCWGDNDYGQLGDGSTTLRRAATPVVNLGASAVAIAVNPAETCALTSQGQVKCWGFSSATPTPIAGLESTTVAIALGSSHACALSSAGRVQCWGSNEFGQLGDGAEDGSSEPVDIVSGGARFTAIAAGDEHTCALTTDYGVMCWGNNDSGQLGDGTGIGRPTPVRVVGLSNDISTLVAGGYVTCALTRSGAAKCWGNNHYGQLGDNRRSGSWSHVPVSVSGVVQPIVAISTSGDHSCAVNAAGEAWCWGQNLHGQLGDNSTTNRYKPVIPYELENVQAIATGWVHSCALLSNGGIKCWGHNIWGQLGDGGDAARGTPADVSGFSPSIEKISLGAEHACAVTGAGGLKCWGRNNYGQLGIGSTNNSQAPHNVIGLDHDVTQVAVGISHTCAILGSGELRCWGRNNYGQIGNGAQATYVSTPVVVSSAGTSFTSVATGELHTCATTSAGAALCWGLNDKGQLGDGSGGTTGAKSLVPVSVSGLSSGVTRIASGSNHTCALRSLLPLCWGWNAYGQLSGSTSNSLTPKSLNLGIGIHTIVLGQEHTCVRTSGNRIQCWGRNSDGQLGIGTLSNYTTSPTYIPDYTNVANLASKGHYTCLETHDGEVRCWGTYAVQSGLYASSPSGMDGFDGDGTLNRAVAVGTKSGCGIKPDGELRCWGDGSYGILGNNGTTSIEIPVPIRVTQAIAFVSPESLAAGTSTNLAATASRNLPVSFETWTPGVCTVSGTALTVNSAAPVGSICGIRATQAGESPNEWGGSTLPAAPEVRLIPIAAP